MAAQANPEIEIQHRKNERKAEENFVSGKHVTVSDLQRLHQNKHAEKPESFTKNQYIGKSVEGLGPPGIYPVPRYPRPVEFHVSKIAHVTTVEGLDGILGSGGFNGGKRDSALQWWGLLIGREEIAGAEQRYLDREFPNRTEVEKSRQKKILRKFTKSPVFRDGSRYGNFRFTFKLEEVLQAYSTQFCGGKDPTLRVWETIVYKQEIMYSVLVHSPDVHDYDSYPKLGDNEEGVCVYRNGEMIWLAQAISETHTLRLTEDIYGKVVSTEKVRIGVFYVWDHVTLAFHIPEGKTLSFPPEKLKKALKACGKGDTDLNPQVDEKEAKEIVRAKKRKQT